MLGYTGFFPVAQACTPLLVDLDLHSGDDALVLGLSPRWTVLDLVQSPGDLDAEKLAGFVTRHTSGVDLLPAPTRPDEEELVAIDRLEPLLEVARKSYDAVVIDTSSSFSPATLLAIDHTDTLILVGASDVPTIKSLKIALETLDLLEMNLADMRILMNRSGAKVGLEDRDVERTLRREITYTLPSDKAIPVSVNRGQPVVVDNPKSRVARSLQEIAHSLHAAVGEPPVTPDRRRRTLAGRMRRAEPAEPAAVASPEQNDPFAEIRQAAQAEAVRELGHELSEGDIREEDLHEKVTKAIDVALAEAGTPLSSTDRARLVREITHNILGYGPIEPFLADPDRHRGDGQRPPHHLRRAPRPDRGDGRCASAREAHLRQVIDRIVAQVGRRIDESSPMVDARLPDGSRVNAIIPPLAHRRPARSRSASSRASRSRSTTSSRSGR